MAQIVKLTQERLKELITERIKQLDEIDIENSEGGNIESAPLVDNGETKLDKLFAKIPDEEKDFVLEEIEKAERTGRSIITFNWASSRNKRDLFKYFTSVLANKFKQNPEEGTNVRNALMSAFSPYQANSFSMFYQNMYQMLKSYLTSFKDKEELSDMLLSSMYEGIDKALEAYNSSTGDFINLLVSTIKNLFIDKWRKEKEFTSGGEKMQRHIGSLDAPIGHDDDDTETLGDKLTGDNMGTEDEMNRSVGKKIWRPFIKAIKDLLKGNKERESILDIFVREGVTKISDVYEKMKEIGFYTEIEDPAAAAMNIRTNIDRMQKLIAIKMSNGYFSEYIKNNTKTFVNFLKLYQRLPKTKSGDVYFPLEAARYDNFTEYVPAVIAEMKQSDIANLLAESNQERLNNINELATFFESIVNNNEMLNEGYEVDTIDLKDKVKSFIKNSSVAIEEIKSDLTQIEVMCSEIKFDYPNMSTEIRKIVDGMNEIVYSLPNRLSAIMKLVATYYRPI